MDVSIVMLVYNHERFIAQAIESVLMQKTDCQIELIIGEDKSPDGSREIIKKYEKLYPDIVKPVYRDKNVGAFRNMADCLSRCSGRYITFLEGDDYWTSNEKIEKQFRFLEKNSEYSAVYHNWQIVDITGNCLQNGHESSEDYEFDIEALKHFDLPGQTATMMIRKDMLSHISLYQKLLVLLYSRLPGDRLVVPLLLKCGKIHVMGEILSAYRFYVEEGGTNYSSHYENQEMHYFYYLMILKMERYMHKLGIKESLYDCRKEEFLKLRTALAWTKKVKRLQFQSILILVMEPHRVRLFKEWLKYHDTKKVTQ